MSTHFDISLPLLLNHYYHIYNRGNEKRKIFFIHENYRFFLKRYAEYTDRYFDTYSYCLLDNHFHLLLKPKSADKILKAAVDDFATIDSAFYNRYVMAWLKSIGMGEASHGRDLTVLNIELTNLTELLNLIAQHPPINSHIDPTTHPTEIEQLDVKSQLSSYILSERLRRFMLSYAKAINKQQDRTGILFQKAFRRKHAYGIGNLKKVATYIHHNVIHHGYTCFYEAYPSSSFSSIAEHKTTKICKNELLNWFGNIDSFLQYSEAYKQHKWNQELFYLEED